MTNNLYLQNFVFKIYINKQAIISNSQFVVIFTFMMLKIVEWILLSLPHFKYDPLSDISWQFL